MRIMTDTHLYNTYYNNDNNTIMTETHKTHLKTMTIMTETHINTHFNNDNHDNNKRRA